MIPFIVHNKGKLKRNWTTEIDREFLKNVFSFQDVLIWS